jgi:hypothetical protein
VGDVTGMGGVAEAGGLALVGGFAGFALGYLLCIALALWAATRRTRKATRREPGRAAAPFLGDRPD